MGSSSSWSPSRRPFWWLSQHKACLYRVLDAFPFRHFFDFTLALSEKKISTSCPTTSFTHLSSIVKPTGKDAGYQLLTTINKLISTSYFLLMICKWRRRILINIHWARHLSVSLNTHVNAGNIFGLFNLLSKLSTLLRCWLQLSASNRNHPAGESKWRLKLSPSRSSNAPSKVATLPLTN